MRVKMLPSNKEIELPSCFSGKVREDIAQKVYEAEKVIQPFAPYFWAGMQASASGVIKKARKVWKTGYGHGISRTPRKIFWRRGNQFYWRGATVANTVGGRRAHPPKVEHFQKELKINKKERILALISGLTASAKHELLQKRYATLAKTNLHLPIIIESELLKMKTKKFTETLKSVLNDLYVENKILLVIGNEEKFKSGVIDVKKVEELSMKDFWPFARLVVYSEKAIKDLEKVL